MAEEKRVIPNHVAIIPDGNRRWAKARGLEPWKGHEAGAENTEKLIQTAWKNGINFMTFWGSSLDNLTKRPVVEKQALLDVYAKYFQRILNSEEIYREECKISIIGRWRDQFPERLKKILEEGIEKTKNHRKKFLNFMLAYEGDDEMIQAMQNIFDNNEKGTKITAQMIKKNLWTFDLPPVDYLIRTGGEPHLSAGFMMWDMADSQLYFSEKMYPDFGAEELREAFKEYAQRGRRFGE